MSSQVRAHRRNKAIAHEDEAYRLSMPPLPLPNSRLSFDPLPAQAYRQSELPTVKSLTPHRRHTAYKPNRILVESVAPKTATNLMTTFSDLQTKLKQAKKQLKAVGPPQLSDFSLELDNSESVKLGKEHPVGDSIFDKLDESTINLQSKKKLLETVKSKEKLLYATKVKTYYLKEVVQGALGLNQRALEHITIAHEILKSVQEMDLPDHQALPRSYQQLSLAAADTTKKVLVLDLDQTLFHTSEQRNSTQDLEVSIPIDDGTSEQVYVALRPYAISFLKRCRKHFEIIAFTASEQSYADAILDQLDPQRELIQHRLYRQHCVKLSSQVYAKDLSIINRDLSTVVLVDNSPLSFLYQLENAVPILPYYRGADSELLSLEKYLQQVRAQKDVRKANVATFGLLEYCKYEEAEQLVTQLYLARNGLDN